MNASTTFNSAMFAASDATADAAVKKATGMSRLGCFARIGGVLILFAVALVAIMLGAQYAIAYIAALGLTALMTTVITYAILGVTFITSGAVGWFVGSYIGEILVARATAATAAA
jgi:hypothetical protein